MNTCNRTVNSAIGFTLIELVITLGVLGTLAAFIGRPLVDLIQNRATIEQQTDQDADIEYALSRISDEIRFRDSSIQCNSDSVSFGGNETVYRWDIGVDQLIVEQASPPTTAILVDQVDNFSCATINPVSDLHALVLECNGESYAVRALRRK